MNRDLPCLLVGALAPLTAAHGATPFDRTVDADARGTVEVHNISGSVETRRVGTNRQCTCRAASPTTSSASTSGATATGSWSRS